MKYANALLVVASLLVVGCGSSSPIGPSSISSPNSLLAATAAPSVVARAVFPPINPPGISCPSDAPQIRVSSLNSRMDIDFSEVSGAYAYEVEIRFLTGRNVYEIVDVMNVPAPASRAEWYGPAGRYMVKVRTLNCGGQGNWSAEVLHALDDNGVKPPTPPVPPPVPPVEPEEPEHEPQCIIGCFPED